MTSSASSSRLQSIFFNLVIKLVVVVVFVLLSYNGYNSYNTSATYSANITYKYYAFTALCITYLLFFYI